MAGGTWTSQNKRQPGVYINTRSRGNIGANIGDKGIVAIAEPMSWGHVGIMQEIIPGDDVKNIIGHDITSDSALFLREMMKGTDVTSGPSKILLYRVSGTGGAKASTKIGALTATALYEGERGNDIIIMVSADPDEEDLFTVSTIVDGNVLDEQSVKTARELHGNQWVAFSGTETLTASAGESLTGGTDPTPTAGDYAKFLTELEPYQFDIVVYDGTDATVQQAYATFAKRVSNSIGKKCQAVLAEAKTANSEWVISVGNGVKLSDGTILSPQQVTWWIGGAEAGVKYNESLTYARYPDAVESNPKLTDAKIEEAIDNGQIVFIDSFDTVKVCTDINTLTSFTVDKQKSFSKNRVMRVLNQFCNDVYKQFALYYVGKTNNNEAGRNLLAGWIVGYLNEMQANNGIQNFEAEDVSVTEGNDVDSVIVDVAIQPVDSIEKIYMTVNVSAGTVTE